jgi:hypothetical protein
LSESVHFALSHPPENPVRYRPLNGGNPVLRSEVGTRGVRDPFVIRDPRMEGRMYLLATDLAIFGNGDWARAQRFGSTSILVWHLDSGSASWQGPRMVRAAPPEEAGCAWAPEAYFDPTTNEFAVFWASTLYAPNSTTREEPSYHRIMVATTTDFVVFSPARVWMDYGYSVIDATVVRDCPSSGSRDCFFYRFAKDERAQSKFIFLERARALLSSIYEPATPRITAPGLAGGTEGPLAFRAIDGGKWHLFVDEYGGRGYVPLETSSSLAAGEWAVSPNASMPEGVRHGTVIPVTRAEYDRFLARYG